MIVRDPQEWGDILGFMRGTWCLAVFLLGCESGPVIENTYPDRTISGQTECGYPNTFFVGLYPSIDPDECRPLEAPYDPEITFVVEDWDCSSGTFTVGEETSSGTARVYVGDDPDAGVTGTITIGELDGEYGDYPTRFGWDLDIGAGGTELGCHSISE